MLMRHQQLAEVLYSLAQVIHRIEVTLSPDHWLFAKVQLAERLERFGDSMAATQIRMEIYHDAPKEIEAGFEAIRKYSEHVPQYQVDANRLKCEQALLCYSSAVPKVADYLYSGGAVDEATKLLISAIDYYGGLSSDAQQLDGRRRTFDTLTIGFATFHEELARLLAELENLGGSVFHLEEALRSRRGDAVNAWKKLGRLVEKYGVDKLRFDADRYFGREISPMEFPVTRFGFVRNVERWIVAIGKADPVWRDGGTPRHIVVAAFNFHHIQFMFAMACVLSARGHQVDFLYLPSMRFTRSFSPEPVYESWDEDVLAAEIRRAGELIGDLSLSVFDLRDEVLSASTEAMKADCLRIARIDVINMETRMERDDGEGGLEEIRYALNLDAARRATSFLRRRRPDQVILFNGGVMEYGALFDVASRLGIENICFESSAQRRGNFVLSRNKPFGALDTVSLWNADEPHNLTEERRLRLLQWTDSRGGRQRFSGKGRGRHRTNSADLRVIAKEIGLDPDKPIVALMPNLTWDTGVQGRDTIFRSVRDWALSTIEYFVARPDNQLVIRSHPLEETRSDEFLGQFVRERWPQLPPNVVLIDGGHPIGSYQLLDMCQLVLVYTGNLGIEAAIYGIRAVIAGKPHYAGNGFTREPKSRKAYFAEIEEILLDPDQHIVNEREIELACAYGDIYWNYIPQPYPWKYDDFLQSVEDDWPMDRLLTQAGFDVFARTFAYFAGEETAEEGMIGIAP